MSMSMHVQLLRDGSSPEHQAKVAAMKALAEAKIDPPKELLDYFGISEPCEFRADTSGLEVGTWDKQPGVKKWENDVRTGYEVDLSVVPSSVTKIRFYCSW